eukprot:s8530_g3.t1
MNGLLPSPWPLCGSSVVLSSSRCPVRSAGSIGILQVDRGDPACRHDTEHVKRKEAVRVAGAGHVAALRRHGQGPPHSQLADLLQSPSFKQLSCSGNR